jgi:hypothetical protein
VIKQPSIDVNKFPCSFASVITNFMKYCLKLTYEQLLELEIQGIQAKSENGPSDLAEFNFNKNSLYFHILNTHKHTRIKLYQNSTRILMMGVKICEDCDNHWRSLFYFIKNYSSCSSNSSDLGQLSN